MKKLPQKGLEWRTAEMPSKQETAMLAQSYGDSKICSLGINCSNFPVTLRNAMFSV